MATRTLVLAGLAASSGGLYVLVGAGPALSVAVIATVLATIEARREWERCGAREPQPLPGRKEG